MKKYLKVIILLLLFLLIPININATTRYGYFERVEDTDGYGSGSHGNKNAVYFRNKDIYEDTISFAKFQVYYINKSNSYYQAYCIEPGTPAGNNLEFIEYGYGDTIPAAYTRSGFSYLALDSTRKSLIRKVLTYAYPLTSPISSSTTAFSSKASFIAAVNEMEYPSWGSSTDPYKIALAKSIATQGLIWEIVTQERTSFSSYVGNNVKAYHGSTNTSFCSAFINGAACGVNDTSPADNTYVSAEYKRLVDMASVDGIYPSRFDNGAVKLKLNYDPNTKKYVSTISVTNNSFRRCVAKSSNDGKECTISTNDSDVTVTVNSSNSITIKSNKYIDSSTPVTISYKKRQASQTTLNFYEKSGSVQGLTHATPTSVVTKTLSVYTQKFGIKVLKIDSITEEGIPDVKFNVYSSSACTGTPIASGTTDEDGIAEFTDLETSAKVYVKEDATTAPDGYKINSACTGVTPSSDLLNLTQATVEEVPTKLIIQKYDEHLQLITDSSAKFTIEDKESGDTLYFTGSNGVYEYSESTQGAVTELSTANGLLTITYLPIGDYIITETQAPDDYQIPDDPETEIQLGSTDLTIKIVNGITGGVIFEKVDEDGTYLTGGIFSLQRKINNVYTDVLLEETDTGIYEYTEDESETSVSVFSTSDGLAMIVSLPTGVYRIVEKQAPTGYDLIDEDDSPGFTILDVGENNVIRMTDVSTSSSGSDDNATLIIAISTGRDIKNYFLIISCIVVGLGATIFVKKKMK